MTRSARLLAFATAVLTAGIVAAAAAAAPDWGQWGQDQQHEGFVPVVGQSLNAVLADVVYDPFSNKENTADGTSVHYQTALLEGSSVYMEFKTGNFSNLTNWETQVWNEKRLDWSNGRLVTTWTFTSDWKPEPFSKNPQSGPTWEPVFHAVLTQNAIYVPGFAGTIYKLDKATGAVLAHIDPFPIADSNTFVAGPLSADSAGNVYYNMLRLDANHPWDQDIQGAWLVKVAPDDSVSSAAWSSLTPGAPAAGDLCTYQFSTTQLPWPPSPDAVAPQVPCGSQRPVINTAPAIASDGTIYDVSRTHFTRGRTGFLIAVNPDLTSKWATPLQNLFHDGCNVEIPPNGAPGGCRVGATTGVDPAINQPGGFRLLDEGTSSPTVAPDGSIFFGANSRYNYSQGHLVHVSKTGRVLGSYHFGWDITPAIYRHDNTYSVIIKDNHYGGIGSYCNDPTWCPPDRDATNPSYPEQYFITQLNPRTMTPEWQFQNTNTQSCTRDPATGVVSCTTTNPNGFEWCINAPAVDANGTVYGNAEDGVLYAVGQGGVLKQSLFLDLAVPAAYTPLSIGADGKIYAQNFGHLVVVGSG